METNPNAETIRGLRELADWLEKRPTLPKFLSISTACIDALCSRAELADYARMFGACDKRAESDFFIIEKHFSGGVSINAHGARRAVCEKVVIGTRTIPAMPERTLPATEERVEEITEWRCPESLLAPKAEVEAQP